MVYDSLRFVAKELAERFSIALSHDKFRHIKIVSLAGDYIINLLEIKIEPAGRNIDELKTGIEHFRDTLNLLLDSYGIERHNVREAIIEIKHDRSKFIHKCVVKITAKNNEKYMAENVIMS